MILGFKQHFTDKSPTLFKEQILSGKKIHSMREGDRWEAGMSIQMAYGVRTKLYEQFNRGIDHLSTCLSVQEVFMTFDRHTLEITVEDTYLYYNDKELLIANDGLTYERFINWFFPKGRYEWSGQIIHWTNFKY